MSEVKKYKIEEPYLHLQCSLGEAPFWEKSRDSLRFVDIVKKKLHTVNLTEGPSSHKELDLEYSIGTTADIDGNDDEFVFGGKLGYGIMHRDTGKIRWIKKMWNDDERKDDGGGKPGVGKNREERMRSNDGAVDSEGRYWVGAMRYGPTFFNDPAVVGSNVTDEGIVFRLDNDLSLHRVIEGVSIPNGTSWTLDNKTIYLTDSPSGTIKSYPYDPQTGKIALSEGKVFFKVEKGVPDGHCQDEEGYLWVANHGNGKVFRVNPQGKIVAEIELPTRCVTCPGFCGTELFITSMEEEDPETYPWSTKYQGALFRIDVGVRGSPLHKFKMAVNA
ncbi:rRNA-processing protein cgr1 [Vermiconidia calcicola]|uniref:rRNA-processing protein cgr1 n=1 Tax=Vermiconidia calcicola TaxID=1690605 RepID=A0ACC3N7L3_9PEZI|nr:rRNA-processing protein cgr1 [Vermiconidia calcicola]